MRTASLYTDAATGTLRERHIRFTVVKGPDAGVSTTIPGGTMMVGTHANCDVRLSDSTVSRYHLEIQLRADGVKVTDLETTNGTAHGDARLGSVVLTGPARLRLGKTTEIEITPSDETIELSLYGEDRFGAVLGAAPPMRALFALLAHVARSDASVLLEGEPGTGKRLVAEAIHRHSPRAERPFVTVGCSTIPRDRLAAELLALIATADGGTLFLDEIGELPLDVQAQLLRVLDELELGSRPPGDTPARKLDVRVIASTHRDLRKQVAAGGFRAELHFRLAAVRAAVPPLRHRRDDVRLLAQAFAGFILSDELARELAAHDWPGNVHALRSLVEAALDLEREAAPGLATRLRREYLAQQKRDQP
jgi:transcriptional regulator with GAF, ATPase, and Fis domain